MFLTKYGFLLRPVSYFIRNLKSRMDSELKALILCVFKGVIRGLDLKMSVKYCLAASDDPLSVDALEALDGVNFDDTAFHEEELKNYMDLVRAHRVDELEPPEYFKRFSSQIECLVSGEDNNPLDIMIYVADYYDVDLNGALDHIDRSCPIEHGHLFIGEESFDDFTLYVEETPETKETYRKIMELKAGKNARYNDWCRKWLEALPTS